MPLLYTVDSKALLKILLHAAKHPSHSISGVLLGTVAPASGEPGSPRDGAAQVAVTVADAIPLFHSFLSLAPALETALVQARQLCLTSVALFLLRLAPWPPAALLTNGCSRKCLSSHAPPDFCPACAPPCYQRAYDGGYESR